ncbi:sensor histidine kinase [Paenibacillus cremeus]|uniref:Signal transduction histidine-protein kinase ArlS n=1 Tax=Paenibacillus cremeus TaxID=2163881 RepID=A0A559K4N8_9BACL|nr:HAMP domain-containing histidine kinase [Paenibacillus cremeus]TVY07043.1 HAMP domain-containing histidine kinase [Paenibacillus cremeus]
MSIKYKIAWLTTLWLTGILLVVNVTIYIAFLEITTDNERDYLTTRAETLLQKVPFANAVEGKDIDIVQSFLPDYGLIRWIDPMGQIVRQVQTDDQVTQIKSKFVQSAQTELYQLEGQKVLAARIPTFVEGQTVGTLEILEKMDSLTENISILISILTLTTFGAVGMSILGGFWMSKWILRPISGMAKTMEHIEKSLVFRKIPIREGGHDELHALASTFNRMMDRIQESFVRQQQFVSDASHEMKTPLTIIEGYARMLQRWGLQDETKGREAIVNIYTEAVRMKGLTQQLLDLASMKQEEKLMLEQVELVSLCKNTAELMQVAYHRPVVVQTSATPIFLRADTSRIKQLLMILLDNALKYSKEEVFIQLARIESTDCKDSGVELRVKDRGVGIPSEELARVFERFYRVDPSRHRKTGGAGLGLSIAKEIVALHGGSIRIESEQQAGSEVIVQLPAH